MVRYTFAPMKALLSQLYAQEPLSRQTAYDTLSRIARGEASQAAMSAVISAVNMRPAVLSEIHGFRDAMLELARPVDLGNRETIDIVGTGGDGKNTFNISTLSSVVVAGAGYKVTKHGSYGVSSNVGSSFPRSPLSPGDEERHSGSQGADGPYLFQPARPAD